MSNQRLEFFEAEGVHTEYADRPLGRHLVESGVITQPDLINALRMQQRVDAQLGEILLAEGLAQPHDILNALARQHAAQRVDLAQQPPAQKMADALPAATCLRHGVVPWIWIGRTLLVATNQPAQFDRFRTGMGLCGFKMLPVIASPVEIQTQINRLYGVQLVQKAIARVPSVESCSSWGRQTGARTTFALFALAALIIAAIIGPKITMTALILFSVCLLALATTVKAAAFFAQMVQNTPQNVEQLTNGRTDFRMPRVSIMVPLLREKEIAGALIERLSRLTYPKSLLNVVLVLERHDHVTRQTLAHTQLPDWISVIQVPESAGPTTKPRALNYALDFCHGSIIGVWDAEDAPEPDQIEKVVMRFQNAPKNVACLQGVLDYYNARTNWVSRCFTIEYATWWRLILPGIAKLGLVIPLGGTTLFFRRDILEKLGGWDAYNVTEDADLGVRLARRGYVTELLPTVTMEEANHRPWPWVRQRSRWLKGFMITYCVHMRRPFSLLKDLGFARFMGVQMLFLATFVQFALAPLLWSFWVTVFGIAHPVHEVLPQSLALAIVMLFAFSEVLSLVMAAVAVSGPKHRHLLPWIFAMPIYFMMATIASHKALYELIVTPFYWDKTEHGVAHKRVAKKPTHPADLARQKLRKPIAAKS